MRLAISNIAWDVAEDEAVAALLHRYAVDAIDIAPGKYFPQPALATDPDIFRVRQWWADRRIEITGMQSLLFGTVGLNLFGPAAVRAELHGHLAAVCRIAGALGATRLVFGSPKNRDRSGLDDEQALDLAIPFFQQLGDVARSFGVMICLEPNPARYGANFMMTSAETHSIVTQIAHPAIRMQLDTGALTINAEDVDFVLRQSAALIGHIHASEPDLLPLGDGTTAHGTMAAAICRYLPDHVVSVEMLSDKSESAVASIERALQVAIRSYRGDGLEGAS